jgi:hypothetical protein
MQNLRVGPAVPSSARTRQQQLEEWLFDALHGAWAAAACRIGVGLSVVGLLISNFSTREMWAGPGSVWAEPARSVSTFPEMSLLRNVSADVVTVLYTVTLLAAVAFVLGWHTKAANVVTFIGFIAIVAQNPLLSGQGDNLVRVTLLWLLLMRTAEHWSLDARAPGGHGRATRRCRGGCGRACTTSASSASAHRPCSST